MKKQLIVLCVIFMILSLASGCASNFDKVGSGFEIPRQDKLSEKDYQKYSGPDYIIANCPSGAMVNTVMSGDIVIADTTAYLSYSPKRFDVIMHLLPDDKDNSSVKRIIGLPGETLEMKNGLVYINNSSECLNEPYLTEEIEQADFGPYIVPANHYFVMGDNREFSNDSRRWQNTYVPIEFILGKIILISAPE